MQDGHGIHLLSWDTVCMPIHEGGLGIQSLIVRRNALLARHASRFLLEPQCLWSSLMRARYGGWRSGVTISPSRGASSFWKVVCSYGQSIMGSISWMVGDGSSIDAIQDTWIAELPLSRWPSFVSMDVPPALRVKDLISCDPPSWHIPSVTRFFGAELSSRILSMPLTPSCPADMRLWRRSCLDRAPIRDLMRMFRPESQRTVEAAWIWKLPIIPRIQLFIWKLLWDSLPTCLLLSRRGVPIQPTCPICSLEEETTTHAIFRCSRVRPIWSVMGYPSFRVDTDSVRSAFFHDIRWGPKEKRALWSATAYHIWMSRNLIIFFDTRTPYSRIERQIRSLAAECLRGSAVDGFDGSGLWGSHAALAANRHTVFISWEPPPPGFIKINFDGSVRGRIVGSAFTIRGPCGDLLAAGGFGSLDSTVPRAELFAAWAGLSYAIRTLQSHCIMIEGDSLTVISWLLREKSSDRISNPILTDCWAMIREVGSIQIRHIFREANSAADWVAAFVAHHGGSWTWRPGDFCPFVFQHILYSDAFGLTHTRLV